MSAAILSSRGTRGSFASSASLKAILSQLRQSSTSSGRRDWRIPFCLGAAARRGAGAAQRFMQYLRTTRTNTPRVAFLGSLLLCAARPMSTRLDLMPPSLDHKEDEQDHDREKSHVINHLRETVLSCFCSYRILPIGRKSSMSMSASPRATSFTKTEKPFWRA